MTPTPKTTTMGNICKMHKHLTAVHENYVQKCDVFDVLLGGDCQSKASENPIDERIHKKWNK